MRVENQQLERVLYIQYLIKFKKEQIEVQALINFGSKVNAIIQAYTAVLGLLIYPFDMGA